ncbi:hypothetical protein VNO77_07368 [Canavalia gladiata]|uniref:Dirigent protein n=1 Tax=Canavalia gladiata TaxID=3824 RepID=A0AAN9QVS7_CANGL
MSPQFLTLFVLISTYTLTIATSEETGYVGSIDHSTLGLEEKEKLSHFRFYFHETFSGSNATTVTVVPPIPKYNSTTSFGMVGIMDNALTVGPERSSKIVGSVEGMFAGTSQTELNLLVILNFALTEGKYNGSTIAVLGRNPVAEKVRQMPVIGGSGVFRFVRGYVEVRTVFLDLQTRSTIQYDFYVSHY